MKALVTAASKHGATREIGETIARVLEEHGLSAELVDIDKVRDLDSYDAYGSEADLPGHSRGRAVSSTRTPASSPSGRRGCLPAAR